MKKLFLAAAVLIVVMISARFAAAQVYLPAYPYYAPYDYGTPYSDPQYDPYAELHALHYQLYLPYTYYSYYCCAPAVIVPPRMINPAPRPTTPGPPRR
jgi:hypothetical protein